MSDSNTTSIHNAKITVFICCVGVFIVFCFGPKAVLCFLVCPNLSPECLCRVRALPGQGRTRIGGGGRQPDRRDRATARPLSIHPNILDLHIPGSYLDWGLRVGGLRAVGGCLLVVSLWGPNPPQKTRCSCCARWASGRVPVSSRVDGWRSCI